MQWLQLQILSLYYGQMILGRAEFVGGQEDIEECMLLSSQVFKNICSPTLFGLSTLAIASISL